MSDQIVAALIGAVSTVVVGALANYWYEISAAFSRTIRKFDGHWSGENVVLQTLDSAASLDANTHRLAMSIKQRGRRLTGRVKVIRPNGEAYQASFTGQIFGESCACLIFKSNDRSVSDYGTVMFQLDGYGSRLDGYVLGNRTVGAGFVLSKITLHKSVEV